jgi:hypothetical protein
MTEREIPQPTRLPLSPVSLTKMSREGFPCPYCGTRPDLACDHRLAEKAKPRPVLEGDDRPPRADQRETGMNYHRRKL